MKTTGIWLGVWSTIVAVSHAGPVNNNVHLPAPGPNGCAAGYQPGTDEVLYTVPYVKPKAACTLTAPKDQNENHHERE